MNERGCLNSNLVMVRSEAEHSTENPRLQTRTSGPGQLSVGIPTYGITGIFTDPDGGGMHGLNERVRVQSVYEARTFLYRLVKVYANQ